MSTEHKSPKKKKLLKVKEAKNPIIASSIVVTLAVAGILGGIYIFNIETPTDEDVLNIDMYFAVNSLDPLYNPDDATFHDHRMFWSQVIEGLFENNQSREDTPLIPCLAEEFGMWSSDGLNYTVPLKKGVLFHDGTPFNAAAVKWNFERVYRFKDIMPWGYIWAWDYMYDLPDGRAIVNETLVIDEYTVRFVLNAPYVPFIAVLAAFQSCILSPSSTPENDFVNKFNGKLVGTGPFVLESYDMEPIEELCGYLTLTANGNYWEGKPKIDRIIFESLSTFESVSKVISGEIHYTHLRQSYCLVDLCKAATMVNVVSYPVQAVSYTTLNNDIFPVVMRKALSYAFNYSDFLEVMYDNRYIRAKSPLPRGMLYSRWDLNYAYTNLSIARQTLIDAAWPGTSGLTANDNFSAGNEWEKLVDDDTPLATYNYSYISTDDNHVQLSVLLTNYFKQIGVKIGLNGLTRGEYIDKVLRGGMEFYSTGWGAAFNDPVEILNPVYLTNAPFNYANISDTQIDNWIIQGLVERNESAREQIYYNIQKWMVEELYSVIWTHSQVRWDLWASNVKGIPTEGANIKFILKYAYFEDS